IVIPPAIFFYYSTLFDSRFKTLQQNPFDYVLNTLYSIMYAQNYTANVLNLKEKQQLIQHGLLKEYRQ
ncbi:hypothetical protein, partial [Listeria monocytogenes]|uniref:hypothetical protein n=1 Tax=Listeria monocytogenes TaxID=1639 RepID=UPI0031BB6263